MEELKQVMVRMPAELEDELRKLADKDKRSLNNYLNMLLEKHVDESKKGD